MATKFSVLYDFFGLPRSEIQGKLDRGEKISIKEAEELMAVITELMAENLSLSRQLSQAIGKINLEPQKSSADNPRVAELEAFIRNIYAMIVGPSFSDVSGGPIKIDDGAIYDIRRGYSELQRTLHAMRARVRELENKNDPS